MISKHSIIVFSILSSWGLAMAIAPQDFTFSRSLRRTAGLNNFSNIMYVSQPGTIITASGVYVVQDDLMFDPIINNDACITIGASNVVLDLNLNSLSQLSTNTMTGINGIFIEPGVNDIVIRNGALNNFSGSGIVINDGDDIIDIFDMVLLQMGEVGIWADGLSTGSGIANIIVNSVVVDNTTNDDGGDVYGFWFQEVTNADLENVICTLNSTVTGNAYGFLFNNCDSIRLKSCVSGNHISGGPQVIGFGAINCDTILYFDCAADLLTVTAGTGIVAGFFFQDSIAIVLDGCTSIQNTSTATAYGFYFDGCQYSIVADSQAIANSGDTYCYGFYSNNGTNNTFETCEALFNNAEIDGYGFAFTGTETGSSIDFGIIEANLGLTGTAYGIQLVSTVTLCGITNNKIVGHIGGAGGFGIFDGAGAATGNSYFTNFLTKNTVNINFTAPTVSMFTGPLSGIPGTYQNVSF
jgi:hypothetical protein